MFLQHLTFGVAGSVWIDLTSRPAAAPTGEVETGNDVTKSSGTTTLSTANSTLSVNALQGATSITVADGTNFSVGSKYWIAGLKEEILVRSKSTNVLTLFSPLVEAHPSGVAVQGTRATLAVPAADLDAVWWDGRVKFTVDGEIHYVACECTRYPLRRYAGKQDLILIDPLLADKLDDEHALEPTLDAAFHDILGLIGSRGRVKVFTAGPEFNRAVAFQWWVNFYEPDGSDMGITMYRRLRARLDQAMIAVLALIPRDSDQDGVVQAEDRLAWPSCPVSRGS